MGKRGFALAAVFAALIFFAAPAGAGGPTDRDLEVLQDSHAQLTQLARQFVSLAEQRVAEGRMTEAGAALVLAERALELRAEVEGQILAGFESRIASVRRHYMRNKKVMKDQRVDNPPKPEPAGPYEPFPNAKKLPEPPEVSPDGPTKSPTKAIGGGFGAGGAFGGRGGHRNLRSEGGGKSTQSSVDLGLEWLKNHQDPDGYWDCDGFGNQCKLNQCDGPGYALYDPGVTGLSVLAFLGAGETHKHGRYKTSVKNGLMYLKQIQDAEGCFGPRTTTHFTYNHAIATLAMVKAYSLTASPLFKQSAQQGIDFIQKCQNPYLAWRYGVRPGDNDTSVSGWMTCALKSAKAAGGLRVDQSGFDGMKAWLDKVTEPEYGRTGYTARGTGPARPQEVMEKFPPDKSESLTAVGILCRIFVGENPRKSEMIQKGTDLCLKALPVWDEVSGSIDMYYWYFGSMAMFQVGGNPWKVWNAALKPAVIDNQRRSGDEKGSWDPIGPWGRDGGRVYSTALCTMMMETYYRYARVFGTRRRR